MHFSILARARDERAHTTSLACTV